MTPDEKAELRKAAEAGVFRTCGLAFAAGAIIESACVCWVHFSERGFALYTALCSMLIAVAQVSGLSEALLSRHKHVASAAYVIGFGVGTFATVYLKTRGLSPW